MAAKPDTSYVKPGQVALDIGANVGLYTLLLSRQVGPSGRVFAFEPGPKSYSLLIRNISVNGYAQATAANVAVSDSNGTIDLFVCRTGESDNRVAGTLMSTEERDRMSIQSITIDDYLAGQGVQAVDFVKMDIQGAEPLALRGMEQTLRRSPNVRMIMEYSPGAMHFTDVTAGEVLARFEAMGFAIFIVPEAEDEQPTTTQWLLDNIGGSEQPPQANLLLRSPQR